jgi:hypothetical protein
MKNALKRMYYVGFCRVCGTGPLGLRRCGDCGAIAVLCDECDAVWRGGELEGPPLPHEEDTLPCPECGGSLTEAPSSWATAEQIAQCHWVTQALEQEQIELSEAAAFSPRVNASPQVGEEGDGGESEL